MNCPHCSKAIDDRLVAAAHMKAVASRPRPGARGLVRNPTGIQKKRKRASKRRSSK